MVLVTFESSNCKKNSMYIYACLLLINATQWLVYDTVNKLYRRKFSFRTYSAKTAHIKLSRLQEISFAHIISKNITAS